MCNNIKNLSNISEDIMKRGYHGVDTCSSCVFCYKEFIDENLDAYYCNFGPYVDLNVLLQDYSTLGYDLRDSIEEFYNHREVDMLGICDRYIKIVNGNKIKEINIETEYNYE